jgi:hypothetical protein
MGDDPDVSIVEFAVWLADRAGVSFEQCGHSEQEERLWDADAIFCEVLRRADVARLTGERDEALEEVMKCTREVRNLERAEADARRKIAAAEAESERLREAEMHAIAVLRYDAVWETQHRHLLAALLLGWKVVPNTPVEIAAAHQALAERQALRGATP